MAIQQKIIPNKVVKKINSFTWPKFSKEEVEKVSQVLISSKVNYWTGENCRLFEEEFAKYVGTKFAISLMNGTVALELALRSIGLSPSDEVIVTSRTFIASVSSIIISGGKPIFADVDIDTGNFKHQDIRDKISKKTKAILCVHLAGWPCDMDEIMNLAKQHNLYVIEDCAQAHGAKYKGKSVGSIGDIGCWSFCQDKIMTTGGEGGMITTNNSLIWEKIWSLKDHGKNLALLSNSLPSDGFRWVHDSFGSNYRMTEMQAVIGRCQLTKIDKWNKLRRQNMNLILESVKNLPHIRVPQFKCSGCDGNCNEESGCTHGAYKCYVYAEEGPEIRNQIIRYMNSKGIPCFTGSCSEVYLEKAFTETESIPQDRLINAKRMGDTSLMLLIHPTLTKKDIYRTIEVLKDAVTVNQKK